MPQVVGDDGMPHGGHTKIRSSSSNYHPSNPHSASTPASPPSPSPMDVVDSPLPPSDQTIKTLDHISSLELALCSNFTCCSIKLPDLHALVEHFEEKHVVALNIDGKRIYPENTSGKRLAVFPPLPPSLSNSPSSSRSSSPPTPIIPLATAAFLNSDESLTQQKLTSMASCGVYTPFSGMMISPPDEDPYGLFDTLDTYPIMSCSPPSCNPDFPTHPQTSCSSSSPPTTSRSHDPMILNSDSHSDVIITDYNHTHFADGEEKKKKRTKKEVITDREVKKVVHRLPKADNMVLNMTAVSAKNAAKTKMRLLSGNNVKKREKAYRCPKVGCTKSYLNPNGLKYHLEKGTCHIELDSTSTEPEAYTTSSDSFSSITMHVNASPLQPAPSIDFTSPSTPRPTAAATTLPSSSSPYFLKIENYLAAMQRNRLTPCGNTITTTMSSMMPTPPATPGSESPNCETNLPLPGITTTAAPALSLSTMISPSPISLPIPAAPTPISPTPKSMFLATTTGRMAGLSGSGEYQVRPMSP